MRRRLAVLFALVLGAAVSVGIQSAGAHQCPDGYQPNDPACQETAVYPDWRGNYIPLFDLSDRDGDAGEQQRYDAQRWRDKCADDGEYSQQCAWVDGGQSVRTYPGSDPAGGTPRPNEVHAGFAATHCFLAEGAHDCDNHGDEDEFDTHDSHGGAIYVDVCLSPNADSRYCDDGLSDTQAGVTIVDHLDCPTGCFDEYHVVRPFDPGYTQAQMDDTGAAVGYIGADPKGHVCGYPDHSVCP